MLNTKLIIITGISGTGKSTTAKWLYSVLQKNDIIFNYLHEECEKHPIRTNEFSYGLQTSEADMDINCKMMLSKWAAYRDTILNSGQSVILEACLYENIVRYFFECNYSRIKILQFYDNLMEILEPLLPIIIHLRTSDVINTFQRAFSIRGGKWKDIILKDRCKYFLEHGYSADEDNYQVAIDYQNLAIMAFDRFRGTKLSLDTNIQDWDAYHNEICRFLKIRNITDKPHLLETPQDYVGNYEVLINNKVCSFSIVLSEKTLFCRSFWPHMAITYQGNDHFSFESFPIELQFARKEGQISSVMVSGNYDWGLCGHVLTRTTKT
jgi:hypothetical protein